MLHSGRFTALLDANVLYPAPLRDFLLRLAELDLYKPKWSVHIQEEWIKNLLQNRTDLKREWLEKTRVAMDAAFPDPGDRHVLAAAIRSKADVPVTCNTKDFPFGSLAKYELEAQHPHEFVVNLICLDGPGCRQALENQVKSLKNPPMSKDDLLEKLKQCGLVKSVALLRALDGP